MASSIAEAYQLLEESIVEFDGSAVGTVAARDPNAPAENYSECFIRDFVPAALIFLLDDRADIVRNFLFTVLHIRNQQRGQAGHRSLPGVMPASFKVVCDEQGGDCLNADFGDRAIGRVAPVDSMMWWMFLLRTYVKATGDKAFAERPDVQQGIIRIMEGFLRDSFEVFPTLLVPDGAFMVDRRLGVYGHPLEIQALFFGALTCASKLIIPNAQNAPMLDLIDKRLQSLRSYVRIYYWLDLQRLNEIHRYKTEEFGHTSINLLNIYPESIPDWVSDWIPDESGYLVGNLGPGRMDFRFFSFGNLLSILFQLSTFQEAGRIMRLFETRWSDLIGMMPVKLCYPAVEGLEWQIMTGSDPKNPPWSYHNGGNWPALLWAFTAAAIKAGRRDLAEQAYAVAETRLQRDRWPEYYDGRHGRLVGRRANYFQTWSASALILARRFIDEGSSLNRLGMMAFDDQQDHWEQMLANG